MKKILHKKIAKKGNKKTWLLHLHRNSQKNEKMRKNKNKRKWKNLKLTFISHINSNNKHKLLSGVISKMIHISFLCLVLYSCIRNKKRKETKQFFFFFVNFVFMYFRMDEYLYWNTYIYTNFNEEIYLTSLLFFLWVCVYVLDHKNIVHVEACICLLRCFFDKSWYNIIM